MNYYGTIQNESYLAHYGTKGQKWGVRRYQNEDGTLTPEGRRRYLSGKIYTNTSGKKAKDGHVMSDEEYTVYKKRQKATAVKVAVGTLSAAAIATAGVAYAKNRKTVNSFVSSNAKKTIQALKDGKQNFKEKQTLRKTSKMLKQRDYALNNKSKIMESPRKLLKYSRYYDQKEVGKAINRFKQQDELRKAAKSKGKNVIDSVNMGLNAIGAAKGIYKEINSFNAPNQTQRNTNSYQRNSGPSYNNRNRKKQKRY